jgi:hypothetical protein
LTTQRYLTMSSWRHLEEEKTPMRTIQQEACLWILKFYKKSLRVVWLIFARDILLYINLSSFTTQQNPQC